MAVDTAAQISVTGPDPANVHLGPSDPLPTAGAPAKTGRSTSIIDIRRTEQDFNLVEDIRKGLSAPDGVQKTLPTLLVYDEAGLKLFEDITFLDDYYLTNAEINVLEKHADEMARMVQPGSIVLELGSGNLRKINIMLSALERARKAVDYYALDCDLKELERTLDLAPTESFEYVKYNGLFGTYDDGLEWLQTPEVQSIPKVLISMGSSIGNFTREEAPGWVKQFVSALGDEDRMLIGVDGCKDASRVYRAYNDSQEVTHKFTLNALVHANKLLGEQAFDMDIWQATGEFDTKRGCHRACVVPSKDVQVMGVRIKAGEKVRLEESYKFDVRDIKALWHAAGVSELQEWTVDGEYYAMHLIAKKQYALPWAPEDYASSPVPTLEEWDALWKLWDSVSRQMIPNEELLGRPIKLRNACIFYLGHIPTFFDIKIADCTNHVFTEPDYFPKIFERGIDPDVDNPDQCHAHSEVPDDWPALDTILEYQGRVRQRVRSLYANGTVAESPRVSRCMWLGYEHEAMHLETLLYMLVQSEKTNPPPSVPQPNFAVLERQAQKAAVANEWFTIPEKELTLNMDDPETEAGPARFFGWDIEKPSRKVKVHSFQAQARPITNGEYAEFMYKNGITQIPASWVSQPATTNGTESRVNGDKVQSTLPQSFLQDKAVRTVFGPIPLADALSWPICASYDEITGCATSMGGRIPTLEEARSIYGYADELRSKEAAEQAHAKMIPAVNEQLVNGGVTESPPSATKLTNGHAGLSPHDLFTSLKGHNVGFQEWTPVSVVDKGNELQGQAGMGGIWEWTSTRLSKHDGFEPMPLYKAFSQDFMDGKHNIVLGGSWATVPRMAGRKTFVNWYQRNYPYVWAGARLVRDL